MYLYVSKVAYKGERGELKHLSTHRKVKTIPKVVASEIGRAQTKSRNTLGVRTTISYL